MPDGCYGICLGPDDDLCNRDAAKLVLGWCPSLELRFLCIRFTCCSAIFRGDLNPPLSWTCEALPRSEQCHYLGPGTYASDQTTIKQRCEKAASSLLTPLAAVFLVCMHSVFTPPPMFPLSVFLKRVMRGLPLSGPQYYCRDPTHGDPKARARALRDLATMSLKRAPRWRR